MRSLIIRNSLHIGCALAILEVPFGCVMVCCNPNFLFFWVLLVAGIGYYVYKPFPKDAAEPWKQTFVSSMVRMITLVSKIGATVGISSKINITRFLVSSQKYLYPGNPNVKVWREEFDGVTVRISKPMTLDQNKLSPAIVYVHGGGWVVLDTDSYAHLTDTISFESEVVVVSIEYRLAPEHMYPVPLDDCVKATKFFLKHAQQYGVDANRIGIAGDSAGGNLAMSVALRLSEELDSPKLAAQGLIYPVLQGINFLLPSYIQNSNGPAFITGDTMAEYFLSYMIGDWKYQSHFLTNNHTSPAIKQSEYARYVSHELLPDEFQAILEDDYGDNYGDEDVSEKLERYLLDSNFAPLMATDSALAKLPPTCIVTTNFDVLRDDGFLLEKRLKRMGREVTHQYYPGYEHGFLMHLALYDGSLPAVQRFCKCMLNYIKN